MGFSKAVIIIIIIIIGDDDDDDNDDESEKSRSDNLKKDKKHCILFENFGYVQKFPKSLNKNFNLFYKLPK